MTVIGNVASLWRYPVKSMRGEELEEAYLGFAGLYGDRVFAFQSATRPKGFPFLTAREQKRMLQYRPRFRHADRAAQPSNRAEAARIAPGLNPLPADPTDMSVEVVTPAGDVLAVDDPALKRMLGEGIGGDNQLTLLRSTDRAMTDCRPVSLISLQTVAQIGEELGGTLDPRRFRANVYMNLASARGFDEDALVGRSLRLGANVVVSVLERDPRCKMISLDPDTGESDSKVLAQVSKAHEGRAGVYCAVLVEGTLQKGDVIELLD